MRLECVVIARSRLALEICRDYMAKDRNNDKSKTKKRRATGHQNLKCVVVRTWNVS